MPETTEAVKPSSPSTLLSDALRNPLLLASRRAELVQLASERATSLAAVARARVEAAPVCMRRAAHTQLLRVAQALQALAKRLEPVEQAEPVEPPAADMPAPIAKA